MKKRRFFQTAINSRSVPSTPPVEEIVETICVGLTKGQVRALKIWVESRNGDQNKFIQGAITKALENAGIDPANEVFMDFLDQSGLSKN